MNDIKFHIISCLQHGKRKKKERWPRGDAGPVKWHVCGKIVKDEQIK